MDSQQASQLAAEVFVEGGPAALTGEVCRLLQDGVEKEAAEPARLAKATVAMESLVRLGQPLEPVVGIVRVLKRQRDEAQQSAHHQYNCSLAAQGAARAAQQKLEEGQAAWAKERSELQAQADKAKQLDAVVAKWSATSQARVEAQNKAQAAWEKERAGLQEEVTRLTDENGDLRRKLQRKETQLDEYKEKLKASSSSLEKAQQQRDSLTRELSRLQGGRKGMAGGRR